MKFSNFSKKKFLALLTIVFILTALLFIAGNANPMITFKDPGLENAIRENKFKSISSLQALIKLEDLNLRQNNIDSIEVLSNLKSLKYLNIHSNTKIQSVKVIKKLVNLETLIMRNVPLKDQLDIFDNLTKLQTLNALDTGIEKADPQVFSRLRSLGALKEEVKPITIIETLDPPIFSHSSGFYKEGFKLKIKSQISKDHIYYTLDGSDPSIDSNVYIDGDGCFMIQTMASQNLLNL